jgi:hypothetical protein
MLLVNFISTTDSAALPKLTNLTELNLFATQLSVPATDVELILRDMTRLEKLRLSGIELSTTSDCTDFTPVFQRLTALHHLELRDFETIDISALRSSLPRLRYLCLPLVAFDFLHNEFESVSLGKLESMLSALGTTVTLLINGTSIPLCSLLSHMCRLVGDNEEKSHITDIIEWMLRNRHLNPTLDPNFQYRAGPFPLCVTESSRVSNLLLDNGANVRLESWHTDELFPSTALHFLKKDAPVIPRILALGARLDCAFIRAVVFEGPLRKQIFDLAQESLIPRLTTFELSKLLCVAFGNIVSKDYHHTDEMCAILESLPVEILVEVANHFRTPGSDWSLLHELCRFIAYPRIGKLCSSILPRTDLRTHRWKGQNTPLLEACKAGYESLGELLAVTCPLTPETNANREGVSCLSLVCRNKSAEASLQTILARFPSSALSQPIESPVLSHLATLNNIKLFEWAFEHRVGLDDPGLDLVTFANNSIHPISIYLRSKRSNLDVKLFKRILASCRAPETRSFVMSICRGDSLQAAIECGFDPNISFAIPNWSNETEWHTVLSWACASFAADDVRMLLEAGADPNLSAKAGFSPLTGWLKARASIEILVMLLQKGADPMKPDSLGVVLLTELGKNPSRNEQAIAVIADHGFKLT